MKDGGNFLILADGKNNFCSDQQFETLLQGRMLVALDGASEILRKTSITPDIILGDMDTVSEETLEFFAKLGTKILRRPDQNFSDLEKAILHCRGENARSITIVNATSGRFDHTIANIFFLKKYHSPECDIRILDNGAAVVYRENSKVTIHSKIGCKCGFFGVPRCKISSRGLRYELDNFSLILGLSESIANEFVQNDVKLEINGQCLFTYELGPDFL
jgi:thiamine pyrophosphokinase